MGHADTASSHSTTGVILDRLGKSDKAIEHLREALKIRKSVLGDEHYETAASYFNIGIAFERKCEFEAALENYRKAHIILMNVFGDGHSWSQQAHQRISGCEAACQKTRHKPY